MHRANEVYGSDGRKRAHYVHSNGKLSYANSLVRRLTGGTGGQKEVMLSSLPHLKNSSRVQPAPIQEAAPT